jgi:hypothetical protein
MSWIQSNPETAGAFDGFENCFQGEGVGRSLDSCFGRRVMWARIAKAGGFIDHDALALVGWVPLYERRPCERTDGCREV